MEMEIIEEFVLQHWGKLLFNNDFNNMITRVYMDRFLLKESKGKE